MKSHYVRFKIDPLLAGVSLMITILTCLLVAAGCTSSSPAPGNSSAGNATVPRQPLPLLFRQVTSLSSHHYRSSVLRKATASFTLLRGDPFSFQGMAPLGNVSEVRVWIFGENSSAVSPVAVQQDQSFIFKLTSEQTSAMIDGKYRILFEIPTLGNSYGMRIASVGKENDTVLYDPEGIRVLDLGDITDNQISGTVAAATVERSIRKTGPENVTGIP